MKYCYFPTFTKEKIVAKFKKQKLGAGAIALWTVQVPSGYMVAHNHLIPSSDVSEDYDSVLIYINK